MRRAAQITDVPGQLPLPLPGAPELPAIEKRTIDGDVIPPDPVTCGCCGETIPEGEVDDALCHCRDAGRILCSDCTIACGGCGDIYDDRDYDIEIHMACDGDFYSRGGGVPEHRCSECCWSCADCGNYFYGDDVWTNDRDKRICARCFEYYSTCADCGRTIHERDFYSFENEEAILCADCYAQQEQNRAHEAEVTNTEDEADAPDEAILIHNYFYKPAPQFFSALGERTRTYFGVEVETEWDEDNADEPDHNKAIRDSGLADRPEFYCKEDSSLRAGFEIVSHPASLEYWLSTPLTPFVALAQAGYRGYDAPRAGMHVHVSRSALTTAEIAKLLYFMRENSPFILFVSRRRSRAALDDWAEVLRDGLCRRARRGNGHDDRYYAINLENRTTIEFRIFASTLNPESIRRNITFCAALVHYVRCSPTAAMCWRTFRRWLEVDGPKYLPGRYVAHDLADWLSSYRDGCGVAPRESQEESSLSLA